MPATQPAPLAAAVQAVEAASFLDAPGRAVGKLVRGVLGPGTVKDVLSGTFLGHPLHPLLTDVVIGSWTSATLLDVLGGDQDGKAAERLIALGIAAYAPTAASGVNDWADSESADPAVRRAGLVHAAANATALTLYAVSLAARRSGARGRGKLLGLAGATAMSAGGFLGAHLTYAKAVGPDQTAPDRGPDDWTPTADASQLTAGLPQCFIAGDTPVLLLRHDDGLHALHDRCTHRGCSLSDGGEVEGESITCPCHGSRFSLLDGAVERGPATLPQPVFESRERDGRIEVRLPERS